MEKMVTSNATSWVQPLGILGYDDTWRVFGGPLFEASTGCTAEHNTGNVGKTHMSRARRRFKLSIKLSFFYFIFLPL